MTGFLRKGTPVTIEAGPFLNPSDGVSALSGVAAPDNSKASLKKGAGASAAYAVKTGTGGWAHTRNGRYNVALLAGDVDTSGLLRLEFVDPANYCPVLMEFHVLEPAVYDWLFGDKAPAIAGDAMALTAAYDAAKDAAQPGDAMTLVLAQQIDDVKTNTVGGALAGAWATAWGKVVRDTVNNLLKLWGPGNNTATPSAVFSLDDASNPKTKTPQ